MHYRCQWDQASTDSVNELLISRWVNYRCQWDQASTDNVNQLLIRTREDQEKFFSTLKVPKTCYIGISMIPNSGKNILDMI